MTISLTGLQKVYPNGYTAVKELDLEILPGEFFTLLGSSGCGKTTTLRMIAGLELPTAGTIRIDEHDFTNARPRDRDVAMVFQGYALYPHMSVKQNLILNLQVHRTPQEEIKQRLHEVARMLDLEALLDRKPAQLSGGQRQRVALGRAIIRRPNVFLMDEPLSNLDLKLRERTRNELKNLHKRLQITTVYVTHDQAEALALSSRIGIMSHGVLQQVGTPQQVYDEPANVFVAQFVGSPSVNLISVELEVDNQHLCVRHDLSGLLLHGASLPAQSVILQGVGKSGMAATLGVRPESLELSHEESREGVPVSVELVESMGAVDWVFVAAADQKPPGRSQENIMAAVKSSKRFRAGEKAWLNVASERLVLFNRTSGDTMAVLRKGVWSARM